MRRCGRGEDGELRGIARDDVKLRAVAITDVRMDRICAAVLRYNLGMSPTNSMDAIFALPAAERLRIVEAIWDSIAAEPERIPVTDAQRREIEERLAEYRRDPETLRGRIE